MEKKLRRRQGIEGKKRSSRGESPSQEDERGKPHNLEFIHSTSQPKPKNFLELFY
jgi:hypothetical protein